MAIDPAFGGFPVNADPAFGGEPIFEKEEEGFVSRISSDIEKRNIAIQETLKAAETGEIGTFQGTVQAFGQVAGAALDVVGESVVQAGKGLSFIIPDAIEDPVKQAAAAGWQFLTETDAGKAAGEAIKGGVEQWQEFKTENPQAAKTVESALNIGILLAPAKVKAQAKPTVLGKGAEKLGKVAGKQIAKERNKFVGDLIAPKKTPKVKLAEVSRTQEAGVGPFKRSVVSLSPREQQIAAEVKRVKGVTPKKTVQGNLNAVDKANRIINKQLERDVAKSREIITHSEAETALGNAITRLVEENPVIVGNAQVTATKVANKAIQLISENPSTPSGILKARKQLDSWIRIQKGDKAFDPALENALSISVRTVRREMNNLVDAKVKSTAVKRELKRQNLLFEAIDNIGPKAAEESNFAIGRAVQNMAKVLPFRSKFVQEAGTVVGLGIVGASATFAPVFAYGLAATAVTVQGGKLILGSGMKKNLGRVVKGLDKAIFTSKNPSMIKQLRADRALILELIENAEEEQE